MCHCRTWQAFSGWPQYVMLAGASVTMLFAEVLAFEAIILMAGYLPQPTAQVSSISDPWPDHDSWWAQGIPASQRICERDYRRLIMTPGCMANNLRRACPMHAQVSAAGILFNLVGLVFCIEMGVAGDQGRPMEHEQASSLPFCSQLSI